MSAETGFVRTWRVGPFTATLSSPTPRPGVARGAVIEWEPELPRKLTADQIEAYRAGRNAALADLARELGAPVGVIEL